MSDTVLQPLIEDALKRSILRANSLITTVFGDAIAPHGCSLWLGSLIELLAPFGLNERLVRTSVFRLVQENWLASKPIGRRSLYTLSASGLRRIQHAYQRIYAPPAQSWNGQWQIAVLPEGALPVKDREALRRNLAWEGYGQIANGVFIHPSDDTANLAQMLDALGYAGKLITFVANNPAAIARQQFHQLVEQCWHLAHLKQDYEHFVSVFSPFRNALKTADRLDPLQCFVLRTLLIHEFRRIQLRDPQLPDRLMSADWPGKTARHLCQEIYERVLNASELHLMATLKTDGPTPSAEKSLFDRFTEQHLTADTRAPA